MIIGSDGPWFGSRLWQLLELFNPHQVFSNLISGEFNERMYAYTFHHSSPSIRYCIIPYLIYQYLCVLFLSRQSAWNKASFQNLLYGILIHMISPLLSWLTISTSMGGMKNIIISQTQLLSLP